MVEYTPRNWRPGDVVTEDRMTWADENIEAFSGSTDEQVTQVLENTSGSAHTAVQAAALQRIRDWNSRYTVKATDYGVQAGSTTDQTVAMQAGMDAAADQGADLLLPGGTIKLLGKLIWRTHRHSIIATQATTLDWSDSTESGAVLLTNGSRGPLVVKGGAVYTAALRNVYVLGPTDPATTTDFIQFEGKVVEDQNSVYGVTLDHVTVIGFRRQECYGSYTWLIHHYGCSFSKWVEDAVYWYGDKTCGENIRYVGGAFAKGKNVVKAMVDGAGIDMYFAGVSFDFNTGPVVQASNGTYGFSDCHLEWGGLGSSGNNGWDYSPNLVELTSSTKDTRTPSVHFSGGEVILQGEYTGTTAHDLAVVKTITTADQPPIVVTADGLVVRDNAKRHGLMSLEFHQEANLSRPTGGVWDQSYPVVSFNGHMSLRSPGFSYARVGEACNEVVDGTFDSAIATPVSATNHAVGRGWETPDPVNAALDTTESHSGSSSVKVNADGSVGVPLQQQISLIPGATYHCSFWYKTDALVPGTNCYVEVRSYPHPDSGGSSLGKGQSRMLDAGTNDWQMGAFWFQVPPGAVISVPCLSVYKSTGTIWVDEFQVARIS